MFDPTTPHRAHREEDGVALVFALMLTLIAAGFAVFGTLTLRATRRVRDRGCHGPRGVRVAGPTRPESADSHLQPA